MERFVLVSGGSGSIGAALCRQLSSADMVPIIGYARGKDRAEALARETGGRALHIDLTDRSVIDAAIEELAAIGIGLAAIILAASPRLALLPFGKIDETEMNSQLYVNVIGPQQLLAGVVKKCFRKNKRGLALALLTRAMGDGAGEAGMGSLGAYVIAKHGLKGVLSAAGAEYPWLSVDTISPGFTKTPMLEAFDERFLQALQETEAFSTPDEVAVQIMERIKSQL